MKYIDADKLKAELDKHYQKYQNKYMETRNPYTQGLVDALDLAEQSIDSLQQEQPEEPDKSLEEAAYKYSFDSRPSIYGQVDVIDAFKAGAEWQASQMPLPEDTVLFQKGVAEGRRLMMEEAVEGTVNQDGILELSNGEAIDVCPSLDKCALGLHIGDKIRIVVLKEEEK